MYFWLSFVTKKQIALFPEWLRLSEIGSTFVKHLFWTVNAKAMLTTRFALINSVVCVWPMCHCVSLCTDKKRMPSFCYTNKHPQKQDIFPFRYEIIIIVHKLLNQNWSLNWLPCPWITWPQKRYCTRSTYKSKDGCTQTTLSFLHCL